MLGIFGFNDAKEILKVIGEYTKALDLLDDYDHKRLKKIEGNFDNRKIQYKDCINNNYNYNNQYCLVYNIYRLPNHSTKEEGKNGHIGINLLYFIRTKSVVK